MFAIRRFTALIIEHVNAHGSVWDKIDVVPLFFFYLLAELAKGLVTTLHQLLLNIMCVSCNFYPTLAYIFLLPPFSWKRCRFMHRNVCKLDSRWHSRCWLAWPVKFSPAMLSHWHLITFYCDIGRRKHMLRSSIVSDIWDTWVIRCDP